MLRGQSLHFKVLAICCKYEAFSLTVLSGSLLILNVKTKAKSKRMKGFIWWIECSCFRQVSAQEVEHYRMVAAVGVDLLQEVTETHRRHEHVIHSVVLLQLSILTVLTGGGSCMTRSAKAVLDNTFLFIKTWLSRFQYRQIEWKEFREVCDCISLQQ